MNQQGLPAIARAIGGTWVFLSPRQRLAAAIIAVMSVGSSLFELAALSTTVPFVSILMDPGAIAGFPRVSAILDKIGLVLTRETVTWFGVGIIALLGAAAALRMLTNWAVEYFSLRVTSSLVKAVLERTINAPYSWLKGKNVAELSQRIVADAATVGQSLYPGALEILYGLSILMLGLVVVLANAPAQAILSIIAIAAIGGFIFGLLNPSISRQAVKLRDRVLEGARLSFEMFSVHKIVKVFGVETPFIRRYLKVFHGANQARMSLTLTNKAMPMLMLLLGQVGVVAISLAMLHSGLSPEALVAQLTLIVVIVARVLPTAASLSGSLNKLVKAVPHFDGLMSHLSEIAGRAVPNRTAGLSEIPRWSTLTFENVSYRHPGTDRESIRNLSLEIRSGGRYAIVGQTGAGKSTLVDLILRLIEPGDGAIKLDALPMAQFSPRAWAGRIGYVSQETMIVDDSIRRNVAFGIADDKIDDDKVSLALFRAGLLDEVCGMPGGMLEPVGEGGGKLSGGQRQRLALARALYGDIDILLLDEATSALDPATEDRVLRGIFDQSRGVTVIMVTHRLQTTSFCDEVFVILDGTLGTAEELSRLGSVTFGHDRDAASK